MQSGVLIETRLGACSKKKFKMKKQTRTIFCIAFLVVCKNAPAQEDGLKLIGAQNKRIAYMGRVGHTDSCANIYWTGTSISINVKETTNVTAILEDEKGNNFYYAITDGDGANAIKIKVDKEKKSYVLAANLDKETPHHIELFKITNTDNWTRFYGFKTDETAKVLKPSKKPKRTIEFFGNSITCGHGVEVKPDSSDSGAAQFFNNYRAFGAITARHFNAQYHCTAKSGIGITISWFPQIMPEIYDRLDPKDAGTKWNFKKYRPDIVVVNLFQNDSWLVNMPDHAQFKARFGNVKPTEGFIKAAYSNFILSLRSKYPKAQIICSLGNMDATREGSKWPGYIDEAVASLNDKKIITHYFTYKKTPGHPKLQEQQAMADDLISFIEKQGYWK